MRTALLVMLLSAVGALAGCAGVVRTVQERENMIRRSIEMDLHQLADDWDTLWLQDRQYRLTRWHIR